MRRGLTLLLSLALFSVFLGYASLVQSASRHAELSPSEFDKTFQPSELKEDIDFLFETLEAVHPNLYAYTPKEIIARERERIESEITFPLTRREFYIRIAPLVAKLNDGHTSVYRPREEFEHYAKNGGLLFPFDLDLTDSSAFIAVNYSSDSLFAVGSEILSIHGIQMSEMLDSLRQFLSGMKTSFRTEWLENGFKGMLWLVYKFDQDLEIEFLSSTTGENYIRKVSGITNETIKRKRGISCDKEEPVYYTYRSLSEEKIGIINFRSFADLAEFKTFLEEKFSRIQKEGIESLIIDIRENVGGNSSLGDALLSYLTDKPFTQCSRMEVKVSKQIKKRRRASQPWWIRWIPMQLLPSESFLGKIWRTPEGNLAVFTPEPRMPEQNPLRFNGDVYVLISPRTFSSATMFASTVKDYQLGHLIGEETGGLVTSYGDVYHFDLPETRIWVGVSYKRFVRPSGEDDGRGVIPDYEVKASAQDRASGTDAVMEFTKELIKSKSKRPRNQK